MKKVKVKQRGEVREVYRWALAAGKDLADCTQYLRLLQPGTDIAIMHATWLTALFDKYAKRP